MRRTIRHSADDAVVADIVVEGGEVRAVLLDEGMQSVVRDEAGERQVAEMREELASEIRLQSDRCRRCNCAITLDTAALFKGTGIFKRAAYCFECNGLLMRKLLSATFGTRGRRGVS